MVQFLNGVSATSALVAGVLFLRFWRDTADRLFLWFALAFWLFAVNWGVLATSAVLDERRHLLYVIRLAGFCLIFLAVIEKNRKVSS
jgi:uncharacterized protein DUF5985